MRHALINSDLEFGSPLPSCVVVLAKVQGSRKCWGFTTICTSWLQKKGLYRGKVDNKMSLPQCSRSRDIIEPMLKPQWWVNCDKMGAAAIDAVRSGGLQVIPSHFEAVWYRWLENIRDWCISRQLWWGHRIPAWYCTFKGESEVDSGVLGAPSEKVDRWVVGRSEEEARTSATAKCAFSCLH
jgi:valyl-tRNA synthetase